MRGHWTDSIRTVEFYRPTVRHMMSHSRGTTNAVGIDRVGVLSVAAHACLSVPGKRKGSPRPSARDLGARCDGSTMRRPATVRSSCQCAFAKRVRCFPARHCHMRPRLQPARACACQPSIAICIATLLSSSTARVKCRSLVRPLMPSSSRLRAP